jgi:hypothetical protein
MLSYKDAEPLNTLPTNTRVLNYSTWHIKKVATERYGWVINTPASYSGGPGSNLGPKTGFPDWRFRGFPQSLQGNTGIVL